MKLKLRVTATGKQILNPAEGMDRAGWKIQFQTGMVAEISKFASSWAEMKCQSQNFI